MSHANIRFILELKSIRIAYEHRPPLVIDGITLRGVDVEVWAILAEKMKLKLEFQKVRGVNKQVQMVKCNDKAMLANLLFSCLKERRI